MYRIIISGGGTGGHIFPAVAIANAFKHRFPNAEILFVGAEGKMEMEKVPAAGYQIVGLPIQGVNRSNPLANLKVACGFFKSIAMAKQIIREFRPDAAVGVGGYASAPLLYQANQMGIPTLILEPNSYAGLANKLLAKKSSVICVGTPGMERFFPAEKIVVTGSPTRKNLFTGNRSHTDAVEFFGLDPQKKTILLVGGSLGARTLNQSVVAAFQLLETHKEQIQLIWQCGKFYEHEMREHLDKQKLPNVRLMPFIADMEAAYKAADVIISRSGASSIGELCLVGKPTILVPSPNVAEDHQTVNARFLSDRNAALLIRDGEATVVLIEKALTLLKEPTLCKQLSEKIQSIAQHDSDERIIDQLVRILKR